MRHPTKRYRALISGLLLVSLCGFAGGLRGVSGAFQATSTVLAATYQYQGLSAKDPDEMLGSLLREGKYTPFTSAAKPAFPIPALEEGYVPQGMCYSEALDHFLLTYYHEGGLRPSLLVMVDRATGERTKSLYLLQTGGLPYVGHAGGVTAWGEHVWVTSNSRAFRLAAEDLRQAEDYRPVRFRDLFKPGVRGGFAFCTEDMLWIGEFYAINKSENVPTERWDPSTGNMSWCVGFPLSSSAPMGVDGLLRSGDSLAPQCVLSMPDYLQGGCVGSSGELMLSSSHSAKLPSWLQVYPSLQGILAQPPAYHVTVNKQSCPLWVINADKASVQQMLAPMSEGICRVGNHIYVLFESAALLYREKAELYSDYVFSLPEEALWQSAS